jgi:hypothetical protein
MTKRFRLKSSEIRPLAEGYGSCLASDHITVEGKRVGFMYREVAEETPDSGWRFFSGEESQAYSDDPDNWALYDVNTIANYDPTIIPHLESPAGSAFGRGADGVWRAEPMPTDLPTH